MAESGYDLHSGVDDPMEQLGNPVVLLIDDQIIVAEALRRMLASEDDITLHYCNDPAKAIEMAAEVMPTVILQDLVMPNVDGMTLVRTFRSNPTTVGVPLIVLSNKEDPRDKSEAFSAGASDYLVKLPDKIELVARIRAHSKTYLMQQSRDEAYRKLRELQAQLQRSNEALQRLSCMDSLTGIANRRRFDEFYYNEWMRAARKKTPISIILVDIDHFKAYNDNYGHRKGDACLTKVAKTLNDVLNRPADLVARYGGEEFVVVLPDTTVKGATLMAETIRVAVEQLDIRHKYAKDRDRVTVSLGVAGAQPRVEMPPAGLIEAADRALYQAKRQGRNRVMVATTNDAGAADGAEAQA